jgi:UDP-N-acetyl-D-mannosaminuronate dehydrogenase
MSVPLTDEALRGADAVMIVTDHSNVDYGRVKRLARVLIDTRHATGGKGAVAPAGPALRETVRL